MMKLYETCTDSTLDRTIWFDGDRLYEVIGPFDGDETTVVIISRELDSFRGEYVTVSRNQIAHMKFSDIDGAVYHQLSTDFTMVVSYAVVDAL